MFNDEFDGTCKRLTDLPVIHHDFAGQAGKEIAAAHGEGTVNAAPLAMGLLTNEGPPPWHPAPSELQVACRTVASLCREEGVDLAALALRFAIEAPWIATTIVGMLPRRNALAMPAR